MSSALPFLSRALPASIFIFISLLCLFLMDILSMIREFPSPTATGFYEWPGGKVAILERFHSALFRPLDVVFRDVTVGFAPSSYGADDVSRWQMMNFLLDPGVFYAIWGFESLRGSVNGGPVYYPGVFYFFAQLGGGGVLIPLYYFAHMVWTPPQSWQQASQSS
ncbi:hypothetical protein BU23DRAFT_661751 [Bimuria novae-zelandiae CBS 107.79]|uniref:Uncharacterized protein n=1 Tax=Bimuria novae-zelandiae CBS 107.79 TaxID=1447943 RepID=A0A6A5UV19_9PLEO|nr:hypothetical protein BU23DRAFT_661751 [Bimuria novae-zelandiae CBS 107.79]